MRRNYISPEFSYTNVNGTLSMLEKGSLFGSKMLQIPNTITIGTETIIWYQQSTNEQINLGVEKSLPSVSDNTVSDKFTYSTLIIDQSQPQSQLTTNTSWILQIQINTILKNYIFATLKKYRAFEGVLNNMTISNDINTSINQYISQNILNKYTYSKIIFYIQYRSLGSAGSLKYKNVYDSTIESNANLYTKLKTSTDINQTLLTVSFNQEQPSSAYYFAYYFNLVFNRI